jgi:hypothetical protein
VLIRVRDGGNSSVAPGEYSPAPAPRQWTALASVPVMNWLRLTSSRSAARASSAWSDCGIRTSRRPLCDAAERGFGMSRPCATASSIHARIASWTRAAASSGVAPSAVQPGSSSTFALQPAPGASDFTNSM